MTVLAEFAEWLVASRKASVAPAVRERLATHVLDAVGSWIAGKVSEDGVKLSSLRSPAVRGGIPLLGNEPLDRITLGVATVRLTECDDIHMASCTTPSSVVVPTCLNLVAESKKTTSEIFATALWTGYEVMTRLGAAFDGPRIVYRGVWPTLLVAPMASAAMTARILDLDAAKTTNAVAIALSMTSGALGMPVGQSPRWLLLGFEARKGCAAALMANEGYAGDHTLLDGDWLMRMHGVSCDVRWLRPAGPAASAIDSISLKPYCAAKQCIAAIEAFRELLDGGITTDEISTVHVRVPRAYAAMIGHRHAANGRIPRMTSAAYSLALAAYKPTELRNISRTNLTADPQIAALMTRIEICPDDELSQHFPERWPARVDVLLKSGRTVSATVLDAPGDPSEPLGATGALEKFYRLTESIIGRRESLDLANACRGSTERDDSLARLCNWVTK